jgi:hypothetical protein
MWYVPALLAKSTVLRDNHVGFSQKECGMPIQLSLDRFEGKKKEIAVLVADDGLQINFPRDLLPAGAKAGDVLSLTIERDQAATERLRAETWKLQDELGQSDSGGDIAL